VFDKCFTAKCTSDKSLQKWLRFDAVMTKSGLIFGQVRVRCWVGLRWVAKVMGWVRLGFIKWMWSACKYVGVQALSARRAELGRKFFR